MSPLNNMDLLLLGDEVANSCVVEILQSEAYTTVSEPY